MSKWEGSTDPNDKSGIGYFDGKDRGIRLESFSDWLLINNIGLDAYKAGFQHGKEHILRLVQHEVNQ